MISIIVCSINPVLLEQFICNVKCTVGETVEFLIHDNREVNWGICKVYNYYARRARYDILCFAHEDILFSTNQWGKVIVEFFNQVPDSGVVGFAGSRMKSRVLSGWDGLPNYDRVKLIQHFKNSPPLHVHTPVHAQDFEEVICLDGLCVFTTKAIWENNPFDEINFSGFHLYDLSFSFKISLSHRNYVCYLIEVAHFSEGSLNREWYVNSKHFHSMWKDYLPQWLDDVSEGTKRETECVISYIMSKRYIELDVLDRSVWKIVKNLFCETHSIKYCVKFLYWVYAKRRDGVLSKKRS